MGVPKFFRWLSERYPAISQLIAENRIPEFDCLYLDMNGIIHNCTHKDTSDVQFRMTEEEMFIAIFNYIEHLFGKIKPKKLFFMAIDGVAPRAKMNQQRARRFRTALDNEKARDKAIREGKELPKEEPFDSNCITPGTEFMAKLSQQLRYFIHKKVSEDRDWQQPEIVLSGHEVPGEGEHKIMEYIRNARAQLDYDANVRHCLYGLDADLIMLGLLSHDPHFCLLREEVTFGRGPAKHKAKGLEEQNFYLMHLCIVREYLELEFQDLKKPGAMIYKEILPRGDGYINEGGKVNLQRLGLLLEELGKEEYRFFEHEHEDQSWLRAKKMLEDNEAETAKAKTKGKLIVTTNQKNLWKQKIRKFLTNRSTNTLDLGTELKAEDRKFVQDLADTAHIPWATKEDDEGHRHLILSFPERDDESEEDEEAQSAVLRIIKKYDNAQVLDLTAADSKAAMEFTYSDSVDFEYPSSLVGIFPPIPHCHCIENIFDLPPVEGLEYRVGLTDGALLNESALAGFPSLATLPYTASLGFHGVNVFQSESRNQSMVVNILDTEKRTNVEEAKRKLGKRCFVGYPFLQEAKIVGVSDELFDYHLAEDGSGQVVSRNHSPRDIEQWGKTAHRIENFYSKRLGILIGQVESLVHVHMLKGLMKTDEGATIKEYGPIPGMETDYAAQIIVDEVVNEDERFIERAALPLEEEFPIKSVGFFLGEFNYGRPVEVEGYSNNKLVVWLAALKEREPDFARQIILDAQRDNHYLPSYMVAKDLGLHSLALSKITSSYYITTLGGLRVNLGLNLKFEGKKQKVLGYSRKSETGWEFSMAARAMLVEYMTKFPDFFAAVKQHPSSAELTETDLWPEPAVASARVKEIGAWLKTLKTSQMERVPLDAEQLDSDVVMRLAAEADRLQLGQLAAANKKMPNVPRNALLRPCDAEHRLGNQHFSLGDRVVYVAEVGKVPIAYRGTVVGISRVPTAKLLDVVFDVTFMSGTTLGERCPPFRGQTVPSHTCLNLTHRQIVVGSKAAMARQPTNPSVTTLTAHGGYGMQANGKQYRDAPQPPPLQGTWRGAIHGNGRGRGGRGGYQSPHQQNGPQQGENQHSNLAYRQAPNGPSSHQQPQRQPYGPDPGFKGSPSPGSPQGTRGGRGGNFRGNFRGRGGKPGGADQSAPALANVSGTFSGAAQQQSSPAPGAYSAVPPPASLDSPRGGRGGRGRGGRGRGEGRGRGGAGRGGRGSGSQ
ncbi:hypothetical protein NEUTE1DRAFT_127448 [Neurospora tetrasperma FGSC 2508]|uniref:5'-3' exoribonuclease 1 n=1 Tax=Neurospora tetrasperma (strain FGSC 2508 / ATCC MYA-4615 / P0657) TaxID=510951 RepID=F8MDB2_NEUT8|nr:uncharacterized protein NEUTE1DRAFT_127448 [Neurospora tetrasperma FGSC 2508]EGO60604.1 hypothetical protein NEUTE1DRAFT_127448 [Neurospora tetrasperma FGSC 2508]EGZ75414.1 5'-3' exoribonuclease 1 [Neurospora tetrasperma FGSC 2509]